MESNLARQTCVCVCVCPITCLSIPRDSLQRESGGEKQASSPSLSNYKWQICYQESVWHLTTHDNLSALCRYSVTDWRPSLSVSADWQIKTSTTNQTASCPLALISNDKARSLWPISHLSSSSSFLYCPFSFLSFTFSYWFSLSPFLSPSHCPLPLHHLKKPALPLQIIYFLPVG